MRVSKRVETGLLIVGNLAGTALLLAVHMWLVAHGYVPVDWF